MADRPNPTRRVLALCLAGATAAQAVAAIIFFFAANWWDMAPAAKTGLLDVLLLACATAAALAAPASFARAAATVAGIVISGILFAVHGQIWQTGADTWELFAAWGAMGTLWALLARADATWLTTTVIATIGAWLFVSTAAPPDLIAEHWSISVLAVVPALVGALRWGALRLPGTASAGGWLIPVLLAMAAGLLGLGGVWSQGDSDQPLLAGLALAAATMAVARPRICGPWPFAIALILGVVLLETLLLRRILQDVHGDLETAIRLMLAAAAMLAGIAGLSVALRRLFAGLLPLPGAARLEALLSAAIGTGAWIAAFTATAGWGLIADLTFGRDHPGLLVAGFAAAIAVATALRSHHPQTFGTQVRAAFATLAYGGLVFETTAWFSGLTAPTLAAALLLPPLLMLVRTPAAGALATLLTLGLATARLSELGSVVMAGFAIALAFAGWVGLAWERSRDKVSTRAAALCLLVAAFVIPGAQEWVGSGDATISRAAAALAAAGLMAASLWRRRDLAEPRIAAAGLATLAGSLVVPAGGAGLVGLTAASTLAVGRPLVGLGFAAAAWSVIRFYDLLAVPLADKAALLALGAGLTAVAWALVAGRPRGRPALRPASALLLAGALVPAGLEALEARHKAAIVAQGREILLPLRPTDPRSLIQGDFMALRYDAELMAGLNPAGGAALLRVDADQVAHSARPDDGSAGPTDIAIRVRPGREQPRLAPDSFLFQEGTATDWQAARFAIVRIAGGELVMTGLADQQRQPIRPR